MRGINSNKDKQETIDKNTAKGTGLAVVLSEFSIGDALFLSASVLGFLNTKPSREPGGLLQSKKSLVSKPAD